MLFETGFDKLFDKIIFVQCDDEIRLHRLIERNKITKSQALNRMNSQQAQDEKIKKSDYILYNNSTITNLEAQVALLLTNIINTQNT